ncbi:hypothetical protein M422DRAFT_50157 [Sphaerobolus stellatus SS14]|uniref:Cytochrome P450 n=1 Tax=Sphaerobolus stellatus (strain SS14) TaxID=990650 RepID=A0A0C9UTG0_SPHS4|nr:hypothetical protein M422DRAFT_50157 [Sphaerobolus stellatus SS14]
MLLHLWDMEQEYGPLFTFTMPGLGRNFVINQPEWLDQVRKGDGSVWRKGDAAILVFSEFPGPQSTVAMEGAQWRISPYSSKKGSLNIFSRPIVQSKSFDKSAANAMNKILSIGHKMLCSAAEQGLELDFNEFAGRLVTALFLQFAFSLEMDL